VRIVNDDGVNFLRRSSTRYDAIISDGKSRSGHAGNALFYSEDYYRSGRDHLGPDGVMIQWVPLDVPPGDLRTILRTFTRVFPHTYLWLAQDSCFVAGTQRTLALDLEDVAAALAAPEVADLRRHGWRSAEDVATLLVADAPALQGWLSQEDEVNSLEHPVLEFYSPRSLAVPEGQRVAENLAAILATRRAPLQDVRLAGADRAVVEARAGAVRRVVAALASFGQAGGGEDGVARIEAALEAAQDNGALGQWVATALFNAGRDRDFSGDLAGAAALYARALGAWPELAEAQVNLGRVLALQGRLGEAMAQFRMAIEVNPLSGAAHVMLGEALQASGQPEAALPHFQEALRIAPAQADVHDASGLAFLAIGRFHQALAEWKEAVRLRPAWAQPMEREALLLATDPDPQERDAEEAVRLARRALELTGSRDPGALEVLAVAYAAAGRFIEATSAERDVLALATGARDAALVAQATEALQRYERGLPPPPLVSPGPPVAR
jgi:spermidine synthase